jgi:hypothetical protein
MHVGFLDSKWKRESHLPGAVLSLFLTFDLRPLHSPLTPLGTSGRARPRLRKTTPGKLLTPYRFSTLPLERQSQGGARLLGFRAPSASFSTQPCVGIHPTSPWND